MEGANRRKRILLLSLLPLLLLGCSEGSLLVPDLSEEDAPELSTVAQGTILSDDEALPIVLPEDNGGEYTRLDIILRTPEGEVVYTTSYESDLLSEPVLPDLPLPALEEGTYLVELLLFDQQLEVAREESLFFFTRETLAIQGITLYPPTSEPEAQLIAEAHISRSSSEIDPYLRWRLGSRVLQEGVFSEEGATARLETDDEAGAFTLTLEVFPWAPPPALSYEFRSPINHTTDVLVRPAGAKRAVEGYLVYGFDGHGRARGALATALPDTEKGAYDWQTEGEPLLTLRDETFGYEVGGEARFYHRRFILPKSENDGLLPFRVDLLFLPLAASEEAQPFLATGDGVRELLFGLTGEGAPFVELRQADTTTTVTGSIRIVETGEPLDLGVEVYPNPEEIAVHFSAGGTMIEELTVPWSAQVGASDQTEVPQGPLGLGHFDRPGSVAGTVLSGAGSFRYVVDELTVTKLDEQIERPPSRFLQLSPGESVALSIPQTAEIARRYTVDETSSGGVVLELEAAEGFRQLALLEGGETLLLSSVQGEAVYTLNGGDRQRLDSGVLRMRAIAGGPPITVLVQELTR